MSSEITKRKSYLHLAVPRLTTYQTIDSFGVHGNNGYKTAKEHFLWNGNGYKKPFAAERIKFTLRDKVLAMEIPFEQYYANIWR